MRENRTYDQVFGRDPRGDGDPGLELFGDNVSGTPDATQGITPNAHALSRDFPLLDHLYANSEVSVDGHLITAGSIATDYVQKATQANYSNRGRAFDFGIYPVTFGPNAFLFDQAARQDLSFFNYGEQAAGSTPMGDDGREYLPGGVRQHRPDDVPGEPVHRLPVASGPANELHPGLGDRGAGRPAVADPGASGSASRPRSPPGTCRG